MRAGTTALAINSAIHFGASLVTNLWLAVQAARESFLCLEPSSTPRSACTACSTTERRNIIQRFKTCYHCWAVHDRCCTPLAKLSSHCYAGDVRQDGDQHHRGSATSSGMRVYVTNEAVLRQQFETALAAAG